MVKRPPFLTTGKKGNTQEEEGWNGKAKQPANTWGMAALWACGLGLERPCASGDNCGPEGDGEFQPRPLHEAGPQWVPASIMN